MKSRKRIVNEARYFFLNYVSCTLLRAGLRGATGAIAPGPPLQGGPPWWNFFVSNKILVWKVFVVQRRYKNATILLYSYVDFQQLISPQEGCQTHFYWGPYQHYGCPETASCYCMVALKRPVVTELTTIIYATLMLKERLCDNNGYFAVKRTLKLNNFLKREMFGQQDD